MGDVSSPKGPKFGRGRSKLQSISKIWQNRSLSSPYYSELESTP